MISQHGKLRGAVAHPHPCRHHLVCPCPLLHQYLHPCQQHAPDRLEVALANGSRRQTLMHFSQTSTMRLAQERTSSHTLLWWRQRPPFQTLQIPVNVSKTNWSSLHSWGRRAMRPPAVGRQPQVVHRPGATASKKRWAVNRVVARSTALVVTPAQRRGSTVLVLRARHIKVVGQCSSAGTTIMVLAASISITMQLSLSMIQVVLHPTRSWLTKQHFGSG